LIAAAPKPARAHFPVFKPWRRKGQFSVLLVYECVVNVLREESSTEVTQAFERRVSCGYETL